MSSSKRARKQRKFLKHISNSANSDKTCPKPGECFEYGPLRMSKHGGQVLLENSATPEQLEQMRQHFASQLEHICSDISTSATGCCEIVSKVNPISLMARCFWYWTKHFLDAPGEESSRTRDQLAASWILEYTQKLILACGSVEADAPDISDTEFSELTNLISRIFDHFHVSYFICRTAKWRERADYNKKYDEYAVRAEMTWLTVRGHRYCFHEAEYFRKLLETQADILKRAYGISPKEISEGVNKLLESLTKGVFRASREFRSFQIDTLNAIGNDVNLSNMRPEDAMAYVIRDNGWGTRKDYIFESLFGTGLFDVQALTGWPIEFIDDLSAIPSQDTKFISGDVECAWPTRESALQFSPFLKCGNKSFLFTQHNLTDRLYRAIERGIRGRLKSLDSWNRGQKAATEKLTAEKFSKVLPGAKVYLDAHYKYNDPKTSTVQWTECDVILVYERMLFVVEVKAARYTHKPPGRHVLDHLQSLKDLIQAAATQANRLVDTLFTDQEVRVHNAKKSPVSILQSGDFDEIFRCCVTLDQIDNVAARSEDLIDIGIDIGSHPIWTISLSDLFVIADVFTNPLVFIDFLRERMRAFSSASCHVSDELDHVGLYFTHNRYVDHAESFAPCHVEGWTGYRDSFDQFYARLWEGKTADLPTQAMPTWLKRTLQLLADSEGAERIKVAEHILDTDAETRNVIQKLLEKAITVQSAQQRPRPFSTIGNVRISVVAIQSSVESCYDTDESREYALAQMLLSNEENRVLLVYNVEGKQIASLNWSFLTKNDLFQMDAITLAARAAKLAESRERLDKSNVVKFD